VSGEVLFSGETLTFGVDGHVGEIVLTRPELMNRFDEDVHHEFTEALRRVQAAPDVRAVVLGSTGDVFSAGGDFEFMRKAHDDLPFLLHHEQVGRDLLLSLVDLAVPIVSAVQGPAVGLGATIALAYEIRSAGSEDLLEAIDATKERRPGVYRGR
jgi:enoyl-CoA hydratase